MLKILLSPTQFYTIQLPYNPNKKGPAKITEPFQYKVELKGIKPAINGVGIRAYYR
jgi:hypothetical protein